MLEGQHPVLSVAINAFYVSCSLYILKFKERRINQGIILRVSLSFQCNERFTQALAQFKLPGLFFPLISHKSLFSFQSAANTLDTKSKAGSTY